MGIEIAGIVLSVIAAFAIGCLVASFLNVVIWRVPNGISLVDPSRSFCPKCKAQIAWYDNIPLISYAVLRGRCRHCHEPISARYPLVEALGGVAALVVTAGAFGGFYPWWALPVLYYLVALSIVVAFIDMDHHLILNVVIYPSLVVILILLAIASWGTGSWMQLLWGVVSGMGLGLFYLLLAFLWPGGMGLGDVKLAVLLGLALGWLGWGQLAVGAFAAFLIGGVLGLVMIVLKKVTLHGGIPFGPSMALGAWVGVLVGQPVADAYLHMAGLS